jgi:hypothetical protein
VAEDYRLYQELRELRTKGLAALKTRFPSTVTVDLEVDNIEPREAISDAIKRHVRVLQRPARASSLTWVANRPPSSASWAEGTSPTSQSCFPRRRFVCPTVTKLTPDYRSVSKHLLLHAETPLLVVK